MTKPHHKPLIALPTGLNTSAVSGYEMKQAYVSAVMAVGGEPVLLPTAIPAEDLPHLVSLFDGFLFSGGADVDPALYGGSMQPGIYGINPERDGFELALIPLVLSAHRPLLTICRGTQVLNVALGGSLYGDIATQLPGALKHDWFPSFPRDYLAHDVRVESDTQLAAILKEQNLKTNSLHHQSIHVPGRGVHVTAWAEDGVIEGVDVEGQAFAIGVQWHPEWLQTLAPMRRLFGAFVEACAS